MSKYGAPPRLTVLTFADTGLQILDFGAIRDGQPPEDLGKRILLNEHEVREITDDGPA